MSTKRWSDVNRGVLLLGSLALLALSTHCAVPEYEHNPALDVIPGQGGTPDGTGGDESGVGGDQTGSGGEQTGFGGSGTGGRGTGGSGTGGSGTGGSGTGGTGTGGDQTGGAAGSDTGGAAGSDTGGAAGGGGVVTCPTGYHDCGSGCCRDTPTDCSQVYASDGSNPVIDDLEDGDVELFGAEDRVGTWYTFNDETPATDGAEQHPPAGAFVPAAEGAEGTQYSARTWGTGFATWGAGLGFNFSQSDAVRCAYDASHYDGIRFCIRGTGDYNVKLATVATRPPGEDQGGNCAADCFDDHMFIVTATADWECHEVQWSEFRQQGFGAVTDFDPSQLLALEVQTVALGADFDLYLDEVRFISAPTTCEYPGGNLVNSAGWVGCDETLSSDDPVGLQGPFFLYGDEIACSPPAQNPCTSGSCCLDGVTVEDPNYDAWGCGIGMHLNATGGVPSIPSAYYGPVGCFNLELSGDSGGNPVRVAYTQVADNENLEAPFVEIPAVDGSWSGRVCFHEVTCPPWAGVSDCPLTGEYYTLQISVVGGDSNSAFRLCLDSLVPDVPLYDGLGPWKFQNDLEGWELDPDVDSLHPAGTVLAWSNTGPCADLGCAQLSVPFNALDQYADARFVFPEARDLTGFVLTARVYAETTSFGGLQLFIQNDDTSGNDWQWTNGGWLSLAELSGWQTVAFDFATVADADITAVRQFGFQLHSGTAGTPTQVDLYVDSITLAVPATVDWGTGGTTGTGGATGAAGAVGSAGAGGA